MLRIIIESAMFRSLWSNKTIRICVSSGQFQGCRTCHKKSGLSVYFNLCTHQSKRQFHVTTQQFSKKSTQSPESRIALQDYFDSLKEKNKKTFLTALEIFEERDVHRRGHVEFIYAALKQMEEFGVERDLETYKKLIDLFPKGKYIPTNIFQVEFMHYPKQQQCAIDTLDQMEEHGVIPDLEMEDMLVNVFGKKGFPVRKYMRMMYWMPKFKNISPWPLPEKMPNDSLELAKLAVQQITSVDLQSEVIVHETSEVDDALDNTWIVSGQSPIQSKLIEQHPKDQPIYVEGAFGIWLRRSLVNYFILRAEPKPKSNVVEPDVDDVSNLKAWFFGNVDKQVKEIQRLPSVHEQTDGTILAVCATGTSSRDSLLSWIRILQRTNPNLQIVPILFTLKSPLGSVIPIENADERRDDKTSPLENNKS